MQKLIFLILIVGSVFCRAESDTNPNLGFVFPMEKRGEKVYLKHAVFLNPDCIVPANSFMRVMYLLPKAGDDELKKKRYKSKYNPALARQAHDAKSSEADELTPEQRDIYDRAMKTIWNEDISFRAAFERWDLQRSRFVFQRLGSEEIEVENIDFPEGMLLAEINGKITVLYVEKESLAGNHGIKPQMILLGVNDRPFEGKLDSFQKIYFEEKAKKQSGDRLLSLKVNLPNSSEEKIIPLKLPLSLNSDIWSQTQ